ncbi:MAG: hypothetical protein ACOH5I_07015 [Oligoflexus sp.]
MITNRIWYRLERFFVVSAVNRVILIMLMIFFISLAAGALIFLWDGQFDELSSAVWWAFLRLSDPGYLGDDAGLRRRSISTVLTVLGYVVFLGALVAIMTQVLHQQMARLQLGLTPISLRGHIIILGWNRKTADVVRNLLLAPERWRIFKFKRKTPRLNIVILVDELNDRLRETIRAELGDLWSDQRILIRSGSALRLAHLERVNYQQAAAIILTAPEAYFEVESMIDAITLKTFLSSVRGLEDPDRIYPRYVVELVNKQNVHLVKDQYAACDVVSSSSLIGQMIAQMVYHRGLARVFNLIVEHNSDYDLQVMTMEEAVDQSFQVAFEAVQGGVLIGILRLKKHRFQPLLVPSPEEKIVSTDRLIILTDNESEVQWRSSDEEVAASTREISDLPLLETGEIGGISRILIFGWNRKVIPMLQNLDSMAQGPCSITLVSLKSDEDRRDALQPFLPHLRNLSVTIIQEDFCSREFMESMDVASFHSIVILASDWLDIKENSDVRTIMGYLILKDCLAQSKNTPHIVIELWDQANDVIFHGLPHEVITGPEVSAHLLANVTLRPELRQIYEEILGPNGTQIVFYRLRRSDSQNLTVAELGKHLYATNGEILIGLVCGQGGLGDIELNPEKYRELQWQANDELVVLKHS